MHDNIIVLVRCLVDWIHVEVDGPVRRMSRAQRELELINCARTVRECRGRHNRGLKLGQIPVTIINAGLRNFSIAA